MLLGREERDQWCLLVMAERFAFLFRWRERHQAYFAFGRMKSDKTREVLIDAPPLYSRCIQKMPSTGTWHFPRAPPVEGGRGAERDGYFACVKRGGPSTS